MTRLAKKKEDIEEEEEVEEEGDDHGSLGVITGHCALKQERREEKLACNGVGSCNSNKGCK